jgi:hypothetical protein
MTNRECRMTNASGRRVTVGRWLCALVVLLVCPSCALRNLFNPRSTPAPVVLPEAASLDQIMGAVNANAQKVQSYQTNNARIEVLGALGIPALRGNIVAMRPGRVRLQASTTFTGPEIDLGSNDELFWFWVKQNQPPAVYFARHTQRPGSAAQQLMPIEPQWLLDALGMAEFRPTDRHTGPVPAGKGRVEITSYVTAASGPLVKRTVVDPARALIMEQHLYDGAGNLLASAIVTSHHYYESAGIVLPQTVEVRVPPAELDLEIDAGTVELNRVVDNPQLWTMLEQKGYPPVDLGIQPPLEAGSVAPPMGAQINGANWYDAPAVGAAPQPAVGAPPPVIGTPQPVGGSSAGWPAGAPVAAPATVQPPPTFAPQASGAPAPQFLPPGGVTAPAAATFASTPVDAPAAAQRLPASGVTAAAFTR